MNYHQEDDFIDPIWRLSDALSVEQAAALLAGYDPGFVARCQNDTNFNSRFSRIYPARTSLINAINAKKLRATIRYDAEPRYTAGLDNLREREYWQREDVREHIDHDGESYVIDAIPNWDATTVDVDDLKAWLSSRGYRSGFFFPDETDGVLDYLNPNHDRYPIKLAAAIKVWQAMEDENLIRGKAVKDAMREWLESRYKELRLTWKGEINKSGIDEVVKVANWNIEGGATKTPT